MIGLIEPPGRIAGGEVWLRGRRIDNCRPSAMRRIRGKRIGMVFQDPLTSLNPLYRIGDQLIETIATHTTLGRRRGAHARRIALLAEVGIPAPEARIDAYPHQFSGGMRQRVVLALALCGRARSSSSPTSRRPRSTSRCRRRSSRCSSGCAASTAPP